MTVCMPIKELKNTADFTRTVHEADGPVIVTKNGVPAFVSMTKEQYDALCFEASRSRLYDEIKRGEFDVQAGRTVDAHDSISRMRERYGL